MEVIKSYAKINLGLQVDKRTKNGYHKIRSVMSLIDLYDEMTFEESESIIVNMDLDICSMERNLCYKVAKYLQEKYKVSKGIKITIRKNIPSGSGLGGGSSNAAETIKYLNQFWDLGMTTKKMKKIGKLFGCDIPFFIEGKVSYAYNFGEKLKTIDCRLDDRKIIIISPGVSLNTKDIYEATKIDKKNNIHELLKNMKDNGYKKYVFNDLEEAANNVGNNVIKNIKNKLIDRKCYSVMTGSGSCVVCFPENDECFNELVSYVQEQFEEEKIFITQLKMYSC